VKSYYAKIIIHCSRCPTYQSLSKQKTFNGVVKTSVRMISHSDELCSKSCIVKRSETLLIWSACC